MQTPITFTVLGDSAASGVGDTDKNGNTMGWAHYLSSSFTQPVNYRNLARPGAQSAEVVDVQLPIALELRPNIAAVIVGGNDALRNGFDPEKYYQNMRKTLLELSNVGAHILLLQLHDPTKIVKLPKLLGKILLRRINTVNAITQSLANEFNLDLLRTRRIENIYDRKVWHIDRMHPSKYGHQLMAQHFRKLLIGNDWQINPIQIEEIETTSRRQSLKWMLKNGTPWLLKRSVDLLPAVITLMAIETFKILTKRDNREPSNIYYPNFSAQSELRFQEVREQRVS